MIFKNQTIKEIIMKIIELIKEKLGLDDKDLEKDLDLNSVKKMQMHLDDMADELIAQNQQKEAEQRQAESSDWLKRISEGRANSKRVNQARKKLTHQSRISPARLRKLKAEGKI
jgi:hypothetical protein